MKKVLVAIFWMMLMMISVSGVDEVLIQDTTSEFTDITVDTLSVNYDLDVGGDTNITGTAYIGTGSASTSALLELSSTSKGFLPPRMTDSQRDAISSPAEGLMIYDITNNKADYYDGTVWKAFVSTNVSTFAVGSVPFATGAHHLNDDNDNFFWDNINKRLGIGTNNATAKLEVVGDIISKGTFWTVQNSSALNYWRDVAYGNGIFVAVATTGSGNRVMTSPDGIRWTNRTSAADNQWYGVTYGNGLFVAVADTGTGNRVMTSPDGITWTSRTSASDNDWISVTYGNGIFVAVSDDGTNRVMTSPDGITWTNRSAAVDNVWRDVTYGNGLFVAVATTGSGNRVMTSPDGITWTSRTSASDDSWNSVTYGNGLFVATSYLGGADGIMTSPDGITWTSRTNPENYEWLAVTYGDGLFVAVGNAGGTGNMVMTSPDGIMWTSRNTPADYGWRGVVYGNGMFVAVASGPGSGVMTSGKSEFNEVPTDNIYQGGMSIYGDVALNDDVNVNGIINMNVPGSGQTTKINFFDENFVERVKLEFTDSVSNGSFRVESQGYLGLYSLGGRVDIYSETGDILLDSGIDDIRFFAQSGQIVAEQSELKLAGSPLRIDVDSAFSNNSIGFYDNLGIRKADITFTDDVGDGSFSISSKGPMSISSDVNVTISSLAGSYTGGSAYVCVNNNGTLFASEVACP